MLFASYTDSAAESLMSASGSGTRFINDRHHFRASAVTPRRTNSGVVPMLPKLPSSRKASSMLTVHLKVLCLAFAAVSANSAEPPAPAPVDTRIAIALTPVERDYILAGMRGHLCEFQSIASALAANDRAGAQAAALLGGSKHFAELTNHPAGMERKWPEAWKFLLRARLQSFDTLAQGMQDGDSQSQLLRRLATAIQTCTACHAAYRLTAAQE